jgi:hypothetical protein
MTGHAVTVRPGRGWNESRRTGLPVESNFVWSCTCGATMQCCTANPATAQSWADEHVARMARTAEDWLS